MSGAFEPAAATSHPGYFRILELPSMNLDDTSWFYLVHTWEYAQDTGQSLMMQGISGYTVLAHPGDSLRDVVKRAISMRRDTYSRSYRLRNWLLEGHLDGRWSPFRVCDWVESLFTRRRSL
jgi:hypothetical protein